MATIYTSVIQVRIDKGLVVKIKCHMRCLWSEDKYFYFFLQIQAEPGLRSKKHQEGIGLCAEARLCLDLQKISKCFAFWL